MKRRDKERINELAGTVEYQGKVIASQAKRLASWEWYATEGFLFDRDGNPVELNDEGKLVVVKG